MYFASDCRLIHTRESSSTQQLDDLYLFQMAYQTMDAGADAFQYGFSALLNNGIYGMDNEEMVAEPGYTALCVSFFCVKANLYFV